MPRRNSDTGPGPETPDLDAGDGFELVTPKTYVPKVKNLLTGLPATDEEIGAVEADPNALRGLIDAWMKLPSFATRMQDFFRNAFQQNNVTFDMVRSTFNLNTVGLRAAALPRRMLTRNIQDSFARTAWALVEAGEPFTKTMTTDKYMMTTGLVAHMSFLDDNIVRDDDTLSSRLFTRKAIDRFILDVNVSVPRSQSLNPSSKNYMVWKYENLSTAPNAPKNPCNEKSGRLTGDLTVASTAARNYARLYHYFMGQINCGGAAGTVMPVYDDDRDWSDWRWVQVVNQPSAKGASPAFFELDKLRAATKLTIHTPRVGFMGTVAFQANWPTSEANSMRVTANQALIVGIGRTIIGDNQITTFPLESDDSEHAANPACLGCHSQLDPYRLFFRKSTTYSYSQQTAPPSEPPGFAFDGVTAKGKDIVDLGKIFAEHPQFARAWTLKLHFWANNSAANESDPEVARVAAAFKGSNFDFKTLVRELMSSPLVTRAAKTEQPAGSTLSIARRDQFCSALSARLGARVEVADLCGIYAVKPTRDQNAIAAAATMIASDGYFRSYELPALPTEPDLFFRQATETICSKVAEQVVDVSAKSYMSSAPDAAIDDFVKTVMAVPPSDPRYAQSRQILADNYAQALKVEGSSASAALKSTFVLACLAPSSVIIGL